MDDPLIDIQKRATPQTQPGCTHRQCPAGRVRVDAHAPVRARVYGAEEIASCGGFAELEEMLFERRMAGRPHCSLSSFFEVDELLAGSDEACVAARGGGHSLSVARVCTSQGRRAEAGVSVRREFASCLSSRCPLALCVPSSHWRLASPRSVLVGFPEQRGHGMFAAIAAELSLLEWVWAADACRGSGRRRIQSLAMVHLCMVERGRADEKDLIYANTLC